MYDYAYIYTRGHGGESVNVSSLTAASAQQKPRPHTHRDAKRVSGRKNSNETSAKGRRLFSSIQDSKMTTQCCTIVGQTEHLALMLQEPKPASTDLLLPLARLGPAKS